jgi:hypothetical protein
MCPVAVKTVAQLNATLGRHSAVLTSALGCELQRSIRAALSGAGRRRSTRSLRLQINV